MVAHPLLPLFFLAKRKAEFLKRKTSPVRPPQSKGQKGRDRLTENVGPGPRWKFEQSVGCCGWFVFIDSYFIAARDGANAMQRLLGR
jgi:hypothetical protein